MIETLPSLPGSSGAPVSLADGGDGTELLARQLAALGHPVRLRIVHRLACCDACCCKEVVEATHLAQSTVSQHLKVLVEAGLVTYRPDRPRSRYSLNHESLAALRRQVDETLSRCCR